MFTFTHPPDNMTIIDERGVEGAERRGGGKGLVEAGEEGGVGGVQGGEEGGLVLLF